MRNIGHFTFLHRNNTLPDLDLSTSVCFLHLTHRKTVGNFQSPAKWRLLSAAWSSDRQSRCSAHSPVPVLPPHLMNSRSSRHPGNFAGSSPGLSDHWPLVLGAPPWRRRGGRWGRWWSLFEIPLTRASVRRCHFYQSKERLLSDLLVCLIPVPTATYQTLFLAVCHGSSSLEQHFRHLVRIRVILRWTGILSCGAWVHPPPTWCGFHTWRTFILF